MPKFPVLDGNELIGILKRDGFILKRVNGSHHILIHLEKHLLVSVPVHKGKTLGKGITSSVIKDAGLSLEEFLKLK